MVTATRIIVLNTTKVGERNLVVHTLSPDFGRRSFIVSKGRKSGTMAGWQPLSILSVEVTENPKSDLWRLGKAMALYPLSGLRSDMGKSAISMFMAEVLYRTLRDGIEPGLYEWCEKSILTLDALKDSYANYHLRWLLELCSAMGFTPTMAYLAPFAGEYMKELKGLMGQYEEALVFPLNGRLRGDIADAILQYLSSHLDYRLNIRSLAVLSELFE